MNAIRTATVCLAAGLLVGCQGKSKEPVAQAPQTPPIQAAESLRQSLVRANPGARVGMVAATYGNFAAVSDVPAGAVAEDATVQILDHNGEVVGYGLVRAVKDNSIHVLYQSDARRGPQVGDLIMPASDAGVPVAEEMPAAAPIAPADEQAAEPTRLPPRRGNVSAEAEAPAAAPTAAPADMPADAPADAAAPPAVTEEPQPAQPADEKHADDAAAQPAPETAEPAAEPAPETAQPDPAAAEPAPEEKPADAAPAETPADAPKEAATEEKPAEGDKAPEAEKVPEADRAPEADKAPEGDKPGQNK